jgi:hypothetical protein
MQFFLNDPNIKRYPPEKTHLLDFSAKPYPDGSRIHISLELTPFLQKPNMEIVLTDSEENIVASTSIIEPTAWKIELTLHIRKVTQNAEQPSDPMGNKRYTLSVMVTYPELGEIDRRTLSLQIPNPSP